MIFVALLSCTFVAHTHTHTHTHVVLRGTDLLMFLNEANEIPLSESPERLNIILSHLVVSTPVTNVSACAWHTCLCGENKEHSNIPNTHVTRVLVDWQPTQMFIHMHTSLNANTSIHTHSHIHIHTCTHTHKHTQLVVFNKLKTIQCHEWAMLKKFNAILFCTVRAFARGQKEPQRMLMTSWGKYIKPFFNIHFPKKNISFTSINRCSTRLNDIKTDVASHAEKKLSVFGKPCFGCIKSHDCMVCRT